MIVSTANPAVDPLKFGKLLWPGVTFYRQQREAIYSVLNDLETFVPAGNKLGKDFVAGFVVLWFFLTRHPCRVVTTSAKDDHLDVLWGEIRRFIQTAKYPLDSQQGGPLVVNQRELRKIVDGRECGISYVKGMVSSPDRLAAMQGHHATAPLDSPFARSPLTLFVCDEASGVPDGYYTMATTWARRKLVIGNPWPCDNFFKRAVKGTPGTEDKGGDLTGEDGLCLRRVIRIRAEDSPNVKYALAEIKRGLAVSGKTLIPGVKGYDEYKQNRIQWDRVQQCVSLDAEFYEGAESLLYPPDWLNEAETRANALSPSRKAQAIGVDSGEGTANTALAAVDDQGLIDLYSVKTKDTAEIPGLVIAFAQKYGVRAESVYLDAGGGGKQHADVLRGRGWDVQTVAFGESVKSDLRDRGRALPLGWRQDLDESRYAYRNRRAQMYWLLRLRLEPGGEGKRFALPTAIVNRRRSDGGPSLRQQLAPLPLRYDGEGRVYLPPKNRRSPGSTEQSLTELLGCSPDEADALVLAMYGLSAQPALIQLESML